MRVNSVVGPCNHYNPAHVIYKLVKCPWWPLNLDQNEHIILTQIVRFMGSTWADRYCCCCSGIVLACICLCVLPSLYQSQGFPCNNLRPIKFRITKFGWVVQNTWVTLGKIFWGLIDLDLQGKIKLTPRRLGWLTPILSEESLSFSSKLENTVLTLKWLSDIFSKYNFIS